MTDANKGALVQVSLKDVDGKLADQVRTMLMNMLPDSAFEHIIQAVFDKLTKPRVEKINTGYSGDNKTIEKPSELEEMITNQMRSLMVARVKAWGEQWAKREVGAVDDVLGARLNNLATECAKVHLQSVGDSILSSALSSIGSLRTCGHCQRVGRPGDQCSCGYRIDY
jgi:hypothetical protein